jgi:hypothetical protein
MNTITIKTKDGKTTFTFHAYKAGESVTVFPGSTGTFGKSAGSKTAGIVLVTQNIHGVTAADMDVDDASLWNWIEDAMQRGMNAQS